VPTHRLLIKSKSIPKGAAFALDSIPFRAEPLFSAPGKRKAFTFDGASEWYAATPPSDLDAAGMWDLCHRLQAKGMGVAGAADVEFAEPDVEQQWKIAQPPPEAFAAVGAATPCDKPGAPDPRFPFPKPFDWQWYQDAAHTGLAAAREEVKGATDRVTIAHLDTGYLKGHAVLPPHLDIKRQRSFVDGDPNPNEAAEINVSGVGRNPGHGTGTLSILAGGLFDGTPFGASRGLVGGAPFASVVPIRVANGVVLFTNSSIAKGLAHAIEIGADVLSMSMGGVPSQLWAELVNQAYEAGVTMVTAAGNNFGPSGVRVPRFIVYPARFRRVIAACGVMADGTPYAGFKDAKWMAGSFGPDSKMDTAIAAFTPNAPWAKIDCPALIDFHGQGTSSATPQVAAAAACWLQKYRETMRQYPQKWMRVEAVRRALFGSADNTDRTHFGRGKLRADRAMAIAPAAAAELSRQQADSVDVPLLGPIFNVIFGAAASPNRVRMWQVEAAQILAGSVGLENELAAAGHDPGGDPDSVPPAARRRLMEAVADQPSCSKALREAIGGQLGRDRRSVAVPDVSKPARGETMRIPEPEHRRLRVFAFDPVLGMRLQTSPLNETTLKVRWEKDLQPGPVGEYLEVVDVDPSSDSCYAPVDLNHPHLLASDGLAPMENVPQFHQQMVYAVAMTTIQRFEDALGRTALWAPRYVPGADSSQYVQRLRIYPHALREANAYYSPSLSSLLFGYFQANWDNPGDNLPGGMVFTCLSHDVVAHETTHALLDGLHRYYRDATNPDMAAFHEGFSDIVALFQHFAIPDALRHAIAQNRGDLRRNNVLSDLAQQFGQASRGSRALRSALGKPPTTSDYREATAPHDRGAVLLAAIFQAFLEVYELRAKELKRLASGGAGEIPEGELATSLINHLAEAAAEVASEILTICIRALDYCPPVDLTFGDYLRALVTADMDVNPRSGSNYRTAIIAAFRDRGIYPSGVRNLSESNLCWQPPSFEVEPERMRQMLGELDLSWDLAADRKQSHSRSESNGYRLWKALQALPPEESAAIRADLGFYIHAEKDMPKEIKVDADTGNPVLQIHGVRPARRISGRSQQSVDLVVEAVQKYISTDPTSHEVTVHRGGCTLLIDMQNHRIRYAIRKRVGNAARIQEEKKFLRMAAESSQGYFESGEDREPFALLHRGV